MNPYVIIQICNSAKQLGNSLIIKAFYFYSPTLGLQRILMYFEPKKRGTKFFHRPHIETLSTVISGVGVFSQFRFAFKIGARMKKIKSQKFKSISIVLLPNDYVNFGTQQ